jgi:predicted type IV restriction endonuclease
MRTIRPGRKTPRLPSRPDSHTATLVRNIVACLADWQALGTIERNVEIKIVAPLLELLGWDPTLEVNWGFQIPIAFINGRRVTREADVVVADAGSIYLVGEVKAPGTYGDPWAAIPQLLNYMHSLGAERGFVTDGSTWLIVNDRPLPLLHPFPADQFDHLIAVINIAQMPFRDFIEEIRAHLTIFNCPGYGLWRWVAVRGMPEG